MRTVQEVADLTSGQHVMAADVNVNGLGVPYLTGPSDFVGQMPRATAWTTDGLKFCEPGDVLITVKGSGCGTLARADQRYAISRQLMAIHATTVDPDYLWCAIQHTVSSLSRHAAGTIPGLSREQILGIAIPAPSKGSEKDVAEATAVMEHLSETISRLIAAKRTFKRGLMQQLLTGQKRFPDFRNQPWKSSRLGDHVAQINRKNAHGLTLVLTASGEHGLVDQRTYFNRNVSGDDLAKYYHLRKGDFAYNRSAMNGYPYGATKRLDSCEEGVLSVLYLCFAITDIKLDSDFLKQVFDGGVLNRQLRPIVRVGARAHGLLNVTDEDYLSINIPFPEIDEQRRIAAFLTALDLEIDQLTRLRELIETQKRGLLSRLLSGSLVVPA